MDIFASLGLATDNPSPDFLLRKPEPRNAPIVSITMWKMIIGQALYQLAVIFVVHYAGWDLFSPDTEFEVEKLQTFVFNIYVWMQFFNQHNCRRVDNKLDIWYQGVLKNPWFIGVQLITVAGQFTIIFNGGEAFDTRPLTGSQWGWSMLFGILTIPLGALIRQVPDSVVQSLFDACRIGYNKAARPFRGCFSCLIPKRFKKRDDEQPDEELGRVENIIQTLGLGSEPVDQDVTTTADQRAALESSARLRRQETERHTREIDLKGLIEAAKLGREYGGATLELHPRTLKDDPILRAKSDSTVPPSQDAAFMRFVAVNRKRNRRQVRNPTSQVSQNARQSQAQTPTRRSNGFKWESLLRSKRR